MAHYRFHCFFDARGTDIRVPARLAIRAQAVVAVLAPVNPLALGSGRVPLGFDVETLPVEERASILADHR